MPEISKARIITKAIIAVIIRGLRSGKSPKEIAKSSGETYENVRIILCRYPEVHRVYVDTYAKRHPDKEELPKRYNPTFREV